MVGKHEPHKDPASAAEPEVLSRASIALYALTWDRIYKTTAARAIEAEKHSESHPSHHPLSRHPPPQLLRPEQHDTIRLILTTLQVRVLGFARARAQQSTIANAIGCKQDARKTINKHIKGLAHISTDGILHLEADVEKAILGVIAKLDPSNGPTLQPLAPTRILPAPPTDESPSPNHEPEPAPDGGNNARASPSTPQPTPPPASRHAAAEEDTELTHDDSTDYERFFYHSDPEEQSSASAHHQPTPASASEPPIFPRPPAYPTDLLDLSPDSSEHEPNPAPSRSIDLPNPSTDSSDHEPDPTPLPGHATDPPPPPWYL